MPKNIVIISSSPRKGANSDTLCDQFYVGALDAGHNVEKIFLKDKNINYCTGCGYCTDNHVCAQKDDMIDILEKLVKADIIVLASPIYFYTICGQLKTFIDRCCARYTEISNKTFYYIFTAADTNENAVKRAQTDLEGFLYCLENPNIAGELHALGVWKGGDIYGTDYPQKTYAMGKAII